MITQLERQIDEMIECMNNAKINTRFLNEDQEILNELKRSYVELKVRLSRIGRLLEMEYPSQNNMGD